MVQDLESVKKPERLLLVGCIVGLLLLALVGGASHFLMQQQIADQASGANIVNLSGRQRMLSQRVSKNALKLLSVNTRIHFDQTRDELRQSLNVLRTTHNGLMNGDSKLGLPGQNSQIVVLLFKEIDPYYQQLVSGAEILLAANGQTFSEMQSAPEFKDAVDTILTNEEPFLSGMSRIVFQYASESEARLQRTNEVETLLFISGIIILLLEGIFIFRPVIARTISAMALLRKSENSLKKTQSRLEKSISELRDAQDNLLEVEKKAVLASVVAGVTHDVNTPLGVSITAASTLKERTGELVAAYQQENLSRMKMEEYQSIAQESSSIILMNLKKAAELIRNFKQLAVDQSSEQRRHFNLRAYLEDIVQGLDSKIRTTDHHVQIHCPEEIELDSYPGAIYQVVSNLIMNSLIHGFKDSSSGVIEIRARVEGADLELLYSDNGCGMASETELHCFDAFFTTRRNQGGSGIGTHVIKTLVEESLGGSIELKTALGQGAEFRIRFPLVSDA